MAFSKTVLAVVFAFAFVTFSHAAGRELLATKAVSAPAPAPSAGACQTVAALAKSAGLTTLLAAVKAANYTSILADPSLVATIFAPTDAAFATLLKDLGIDAATLLAPESASLVQTVLDYHIVPGVAYKAAALTNGKKLSTLVSNGATLTVKVASNVVSIVGVGSTAKVIAGGADKVACKAVVHVIDSVLLPVSASS